MNECRSIFLVDDDEDDRMFMREAIVDAVSPIHIVEVEFCEQLPGLLDKSPFGPKLILMDMNMPRVTGLEMLAKLKGDLRYKHIPVVIVSTTTNQTMIDQAYDMGANAFIVKPATPAEYGHVALGVSLCFLNNYQRPASAPAHQIADRKTVIVVEDNDDHWYLLQAALRSSSMSYNVVRMNTKERAMTFADNELADFVPSVDMILIDLYLPHREDGLALLSYMRQALSARRLENIPIVVFTYSDNTEDIDDSYRHQANAYLVKPLDITGWRFYFENLLGFWSKTIQPSRRKRW